MVPTTKLPLHATGNEKHVAARAVRAPQEQEIEGKSKYQHSIFSRFHKNVFDNFMRYINLGKSFQRQFTFQSETILKVLLSREYILGMTTQSGRPCGTQPQLRSLGYTHYYSMETWPHLYAGLIFKTLNAFPKVNSI